MRASIRRGADGAHDLRPGSDSLVTAATLVHPAQLDEDCCDGGTRPSQRRRIALCRAGFPCGLQRRLAVSEPGLPAMVIQLTPCTDERDDLRVDPVDLVEQMVIGHVSPASCSG